jgi:NAD(P)-dependent dehydrogenase (short-subunit alcohol dehydrogenase family)
MEVLCILNLIEANSAVGNEGIMMKRVLITGANRGIGLALVRGCAARGDRVFAGCRAPEKAADLGEIAAKYPGEVTILPLDVTDEGSISNCETVVADHVKALDILINNAAVHMDDKTLSKVSPEVLLKTMHVNAVGPVMVAQRFLGLLKVGDDPKIVNISSEAGSISKTTWFRGYGYYGSKAAENMYTRSLAFDPETEGIIVIAVHPGWVRTDMGGPDAHLSTAESAAGILKVTDGLMPEDNGKFYTWEGIEYPW